MTFQGHALANRDLPLLIVTNAGPTFAGPAEATIGGCAILLQQVGLAITNSERAGRRLEPRARNTSGSLRAEGGPVTITRAVDINAATTGLAFTVFGVHEVTFAGPVTVNNNAAHAAGEHDAPLNFTGASNGGIALDLSAQTLTL